jgi:hypothetical protein
VRAGSCRETHRRGEGRDRRGDLELNTGRLAELTAVWVPVRTAYGPGVLRFPDSERRRRSAVHFPLQFSIGPVLESARGGVYSWERAEAWLAGS